MERLTAELLLLATTQTSEVHDETTENELTDALAVMLTDAKALLLKGGTPYTIHQTADDLSAFACANNGISSAGNAITNTGNWQRAANGDVVIQGTIAPFIIQDTPTQPIETALGLEIQDNDGNAMAIFTFATPIVLTHGRQVTAMTLIANMTQGTLQLIQHSVPSTPVLTSDYSDENVVNNTAARYKDIMDTGTIALLTGGTPFDKTQDADYYAGFFADFEGAAPATISVAEALSAKDAGTLITRAGEATFRQDGTTPPTPNTVVGVYLQNADGNALGAWELPTPILVDNPYELLAFTAQWNCQTGKLELVSA